MGHFPFILASLFTFLRRWIPTFFQVWYIYIYIYNMYIYICLLILESYLNTFFSRSCWILPWYKQNLLLVKISVPYIFRKIFSMWETFIFKCILWRIKIKYIILFSLFFYFYLEDFLALLLPCFRLMMLALRLAFLPSK